MKLPADATVRTIVDSLKTPTEFVRQVLGNMTGPQRDCQVRLLLNSDARFPDYQVEDFIYDDADGEEIRIPIPVKIIRGRMQKELDYENEPIPENWSNEAMHFTEVQALLGELRLRRSA